jgi:hypothetical protein
MFTFVTVLINFTDSRLRESLTSISITINLVKENIYSALLLSFLLGEGEFKQFQHVIELKENVFIYLPAITCLQFIR